MKDPDNMDWLTANSVFDTHPNHNFQDHQPSRGMRIFAILCLLAVVVGILMAVNQ